MSTGTTTRLLSAAEFYDWVHQPEQANKWFELVRGEVIELPPPRRPHGIVCTKVGSILDRYTMERGKGYVAGNDSGVLLERDPDTVRSKVMQKISEYLRTGVNMVWVIDPERRTVTVHRPDRALVELGEGQELFGEDVLPGFRCHVADFFRLPGDKSKQEGEQ